MKEVRVRLSTGHTGIITRIISDVAIVYWGTQDGNPVKSAHRANELERVVYYKVAHG